MNRLTEERRTMSMCMSVEECQKHNRLWEYEQTGLDPEQVAAMQAELAAYRQAEAEGRIIDVDANGPRRVMLDGKLIGFEYDNMFVPIEWDCGPESARAALEKGE